MSQTSQLITAIKKALKAKGMTYAQLAKALKMSEASVKRLLSKGSLNLSRLEKICGVIELDFYELARLSRAEQEEVRELTVTQESALATDPKLLLIFHLLLNDWTMELILQHYPLNKAEMIGLLAKLDRLKLIQLLPANRIKRLTAKQINWRSNGPLRKRYETQIIQEFFAVTFAQPNHCFQFEAKELSDASLNLLIRKLQRLAKEFNELAEMDAALPITAKQNVGMALAIRPWTLSVLANLKWS